MVYPKTPNPDQMRIERIDTIFNQKLESVEKVFSIINHKMKAQGIAIKNTQVISFLFFLTGTNICN